MPTTRKQKKTRKSRGLEFLSDIENLDMMLGGDHFNGAERERSLDSTSARRKVLQAIIWKMREKVYTQITEMMILRLVSITAETQLMQALKLKLTNCRVS